MPEPLIEVSVQGADQLADVARRLRTAGRGDLRRELLKEIRQQTAPVVADLKAAVMRIDSRATPDRRGARSRAAHRGGRGSASSHGLRRTIASAIVVKITTSGFSTGVRIRVNPKKLPADQRSLPKALNRPDGWRHPVFGNRNSWVTQTGKPYWNETIQPHLPTVRRGVTQTLERFARRLED